VIVLDCCYSGAFIKGDADLQAALGGDKTEAYGRIILTAACATETAQEQTPDANRPHSLFTHFLLEGIRTGEADEDEDGKIGAEELFKYAAAQLRAIGAPQTPQKSAAAGHGEFTIARNPHWQPPTSRELLSGWLTTLLDSDDPSARLRGVDELVTLIQRKEERRLGAAYAELQRLSANDPNPRVRGAAQGALEEVAQQQAPPPTASTTNAIPTASAHADTEPSLHSAPTRSEPAGPGHERPVARALKTGDRRLFKRGNQRFVADRPDRRDLLWPQNV